MGGCSPEELEDGSIDVRVACMALDIKYIKGSIDEIKEGMREYKDVKTDLAVLKGDHAKVEAHETFIAEFKGKLTVYAVIAGAAIVVITAIVATFLSRYL